MYYGIIIIFIFVISIIFMTEDEHSNAILKAILSIGIDFRLEEQSFQAPYMDEWQSIKSK